MPEKPASASGEALTRHPACSGRAWQKATEPYRRACADAHAPCALCGKPIDYRLRHPHRFAFTVDHRTPLWAGGHPLDPANWQPAHQRCNASRGATEGNRNRTRTLTVRRTDLTW